MLKLVERGFFASEILCSDSSGGMPTGANPPVQILRVGKFNHPKYGEFEITPLVLAEMKKNFENKIRGIDIALDYFHKSDEEASGWLKSLELREDGTELWGIVDWTLSAKKKLSEREIRYFSPDFAFEWTDPETQVTYKNVLFGGGLTNRPFVKDMAAIVASEKKGENMPTLQELEARIVKLSEDSGDLAKKHEELQKAHADLMKKHGELQEKLAEMKKDDDGDEEGTSGDVDQDDDSMEPKTLEEAKGIMAKQKAKLAEYAENAKKAEEAKQMAEKTTEFNLMLSEGKVCEAQRQAFIKNDMKNFIKLAQPVNTKGHGHGAGGNEKGDREERVMKLAEEKVKASNGALQLHEAIGLANKEIKE